MNFTKKDILNNISLSAHVSKSDSNQLFDRFINLIIHNSAKSVVKIPNFGSFTHKTTPSRIGRNPITKEEFVITERSKLNFKASNKLKTLIN